MKNYIFIILVYLILISFVSVILTVKDKKAAIYNQWRVPEKVLMMFGLFGGAVAMLITMKKIRHKTKHIKFMLGLPAEIILHIALLVLILFKVGF